MTVQHKYYILMNHHTDKCQCLDCKDPLEARDQRPVQYYRGKIVETFYRFENSQLPVEKVYINAVGQVVFREKYVPTLFDILPK
jgi:hypothetical protein